MGPCIKHYIVNALLLTIVSARKRQLYHVQILFSLISYLDLLIYLVFYNGDITLSKVGVSKVGVKVR